MAIAIQATVNMLSKSLRLLVAILILGWGSSTPADDNKSLTPVQSHFEGWLDISGTADLPTAQAQSDWESFAGWKSWAYGKEPVWFKVEIPAAGFSGAEPFILIARPTYLDSLTLYDPATGRVQHSGDFNPPSNDALSSLLFTFEVPALATSRHVFLKLQTTGSRVIHLSLMQRSVAWTHLRTVEWATGCVLLISMFLFVWSLAQWWSTRDRLTGFYVTKQLMSFVWGFMYSGFAWITISPWFSEGVFSLISGIVLCVSVATVLWFYAALFQEYKLPSWTLTALRTAAWISLFLCVLMAAGLRQESLKFVTTLFTISVFFIPIAILTAKKDVEDPPIPWVFLLVYVIFYSLSNSIAPLVYLGILDASPVNYVFLFIGNFGATVVDGVIMFLILHIRQKRIAIRSRNLQSELQLQQEKFRLNQQFLDEQRKLMEMLAHEVKTPLTNLRLWMEAGQKGKSIMERAIFDLSSVIDRCVHAQQLATPGLVTNKEFFDVAELARTTLAASRHPERVNLHLSKDVIEVETDAQMVSVILSNLLENAYKYSVPATPIEMWLQFDTVLPEKMGFTLTIENEVATECLPDPSRLFERYYRAPYAKKQTGSGLGLYIVKSLAEIMHGQVTYTPLPRRVRFEVWLPCNQATSKAC